MNLKFVIYLRLFSILTLSAASVHLMPRNEAQSSAPTGEDDYKTLSYPRDGSEGGDRLNYGIMLDAGSTGTRLYIYEWPMQANCKVAPYIKPSVYNSGPKQGQQVSIKKSGGLAKVNPLDVPKYFKDLIEHALQYIPPSMRAETPLFLKATAGMRTIPRNRANDILAATRVVLGKSGFKFNDKFGAQVIPGEFEGVFGWLAVNYLSNVFDTKTEETQSRGYLDMGGSSTQITFEPKDIPIEDAFPINLNGTNRIVYTHSYLRFGRNDAQTRYFANLLKTQDNHNSIQSPCSIRGSQESTLIDSRNVTIVGTGDFPSCIQNTLKLLNKDVECFTDKCAVNGEFIAEIPDTMELYAVSTFYDTSKFFKCSGKNTLRCLFRSATEQCDLDLSEYTQNNEKFKDSWDFMNYCFNAAYIVNMLKEGYGLDWDRQMIFSNDVNDVDIGWTLGAMIYEVNLLNEGGECCQKNKY